MRISLVMATFERSFQLALGLGSITYKYNHLDLEIIVVDDGMFSEEKYSAKYWCDNYRKSGLNIKYIFAGQRNVNGIVKRNPCFANNIAVKQSSGDIIVLSCPEIYHLNNCLDFIVDPLLKNKRLLTIPEFMYFEDTTAFSESIDTEKASLSLLTIGDTGKEAVEMPFLMGMWRDEFISIGGYDEDLIGYAGDDNDLVERLQWNGCKHFRTPAQIVHLYHGPRCDSQAHFENPAWVYNYNVRKAGRGKIVRNVGREWGCNYGTN